MTTGKSNTSHNITEWYVVVFDICSSTVFIEDLVKTDEMPAYSKLVCDFREYLAMATVTGMDVYKFLGDGFMLLFKGDTSPEIIIDFCEDLVAFGAKRIATFIKEDIETTAIPRIGMTVGIDIGPLQKLSIGKQTEYVGRPLNVASRLQGSLKEPDHVNKILMSVKVYKRITDGEIRDCCIERKRVFRNISDNNRTRCYELDVAELSS